MNGDRAPHGTGTRPADAPLEAKREELLRQLQAARKRLARKLAAIEADVERGRLAPELRKHATLALCHVHELPAHAGELTVLDESTEPPSPVLLRFARTPSPTQQINAWFARARKLERGVAIASERAEAVRRDLAELEALLAAAESASDQDLDGLHGRAAQLGLRGFSSPQGRRTTAARAKGARDERLPYREFTGSGGRAIRVGRSAADNDRLTLEHARSQDLWLHARDEAGSHVVVPLQRGEACPSDLLADAATLAAHFSQARGQSPVDVAYTARRFVRKPRGAKHGLVALLREKVLRLHLEPGRLKRLLASERERL